MAQRRFLQFLMQQKNWWIPITVIFVISITGVIFIGNQTYQQAPPIPDFADKEGEPVIKRSQILKGQNIFHEKALMDYGTFFGDGALRGPDFTADALHKVTQYMQEYHKKHYPSGKNAEKFKEEAIKSKVKEQLKQNQYSEKKHSVQLSASQVYAANRLPDHYMNFFNQEKFEKGFSPGNYLNDKEKINALSAFFFWGAWVCAVERPGKEYSYTHNWPYDPEAGNVITSGVITWSVIGMLGLILGLGLVLYFYGQFDELEDETFTGKESNILTFDKLNNFSPTPTQKATYKFFLAAVLLFLLQIIAGIFTVHDFVGFVNFFGVDISESIPVTIARSWHVQLSLFWISACWIGASIFVLPMISKEEPRGQLSLINTVFWLTVVMVGGSLIGIILGPKGLLPESWYWFGNQGWEFIEQGKFWQIMLFIIFILWGVIIYRGVKPALVSKKYWELPNWLLYTIVCVILLLISGFIARPETNFVIADFWRWMVIHMWVEAFFEVFTTIIVGYFMVLMGLVTQKSANRVIFLASILFLGSGLLGISHNFYWNAKPVGTLALGSVFSTLQVIPLILLTLEAWRFRNMPRLNLKKINGNNVTQSFALPGVFLFLLGVNFWNFLGAGVFGLIINLPVINYFEHGTYLTVNHGHAALMGVYGNLSLGGVLFCCRHLFDLRKWNYSLVKTTFWSLNAGLMLMVILDLFPAGIHQFYAVLENGLWYARSQEFIHGTAFQTFTWLRIIGGSIFVLGGVLPITWFVVSRVSGLKKPLSKKKNIENQYELQEKNEEEEAMIS